MSDRPTDPTRLRRLGFETLRYFAVAAFSFVWIMSASALGAELFGLPERVAVALALATALVINYTLLRAFVFPGQSARIGPQFAATAVTSVSFRLLEYGLFLALAGLAGIHYLAATALALILSAGGKFLVYRNVVFRRRTAPEPQPPTSAPGDSEPGRVSAAGAAKPPGS